MELGLGKRKDKSHMPIIVFYVGRHVYECHSTFEYPTFALQAVVFLGCDGHASSGRLMVAEPAGEQDTAAGLLALLYVADTPSDKSRVPQMTSCRERLFFFFLSYPRADGERGL